MAGELPNNIKIMPDYDSHPLWNQDEDPSWDYNISPDLLPLSEGLRKRLADWAARFDATLDRGDPRHSSFKTEKHEAVFVREGREIARALRAEMPAVRWTYFDIGTGNTELV